MPPIKIERLTLREIQMPLVRHFETSFGRVTARRIALVEVAGDGLSGWGEVTANERPLFNEEWIDGAWLLIKDLLGPRLLGEPIEAAANVAERLDFIRGHHMTRAALETAVWDLESKRLGLPLWQHLGGLRRALPCGVSIGVQDSVEELLDRIASEVADGYQRIKIKIKPGWDREVVAAVRERFPQIRLSADANAAYRLADARLFEELDAFDLMMLEQPLTYDDILDHAMLQRRLSTPICLDESIRSARHAEQAIEQRACRVINIKLGRVGGYSEAMLVHNVARTHAVPVWCGGMLETGIGRAHNIALSTLDNFTLPGDVSASKRYWQRDIIDPAVDVEPDGSILVRDEPGIGYEVDRDYLESLTVRQETIA